MYIVGGCQGVRRMIRLWLKGGFFFQAEDGIRDLVRSRGLGDVYKRQHLQRLSLHSNSGGFTGGADRAAAETSPIPASPLQLSLIHI